MLSFSIPFHSDWRLLTTCIGVPVALAVSIFSLARFKRRDESLESQYYGTVQTVLELKVPSGKVGAVIGRGGSVLRSIEKQTNAALRFKDASKQSTQSSPDNVDEDTDRTLVIRGSQWDSVQMAEMEVRRILDAGCPSLKDEIWAPRSALGCIIGKGGDSIREMVRLSRVKITIGNTGADPEKIELRGTPDAIELAKRLVAEKVERSLSWRRM